MRQKANCSVTTAKKMPNYNHINMHYPTYSYALSLQDQAALREVTVMTITLLIVLAATVYIIGKIK